jgi:hypothetical protein
VKQIGKIRNIFKQEEVVTDKETKDCTKTGLFSKFAKQLHGKPKVEPTREAKDTHRKKFHFRFFPKRMKQEL